MTCTHGSAHTEEHVAHALLTDGLTLLFCTMPATNFQNDRRFLAFASHNRAIANEAPTRGVRGQFRRCAWDRGLRQGRRAGLTPYGRVAKIRV